MEKPEACELCGRTDTYLNFHHLIPRFVHRKNKFLRQHEKEYMKSMGIKVYRIQWKNINSKEGKNYINEEIDKFLTFYKEN